MTNFTYKLKQFKKVIKGADLAIWDNKKIIYSDGRFLCAFNHHFLFRIRLESYEKIKPGYYYLSSLKRSAEPIDNRVLQEHWDVVLNQFRQTPLKYRTRKSTSGNAEVLDTYGVAQETWENLGNANRVAWLNNNDLISSAWRHKIAVYLDSESHKFAIAAVNSYSLLFDPQWKIGTIYPNRWQWKNAYSFKTKLNLGANFYKDESLQLNVGEINTRTFLRIASYSQELIINANTHKEYNVNLSEIDNALPKYEDLQKSNIPGWAMLDTTKVKVLCYHPDGIIYYLDENYEVVNVQRHKYYIPQECKGYNQWVFINPQLLKPFALIRGAELALDIDNKRLTHGVILNSKQVDSHRDYRVIGCIKGINMNEHLSLVKTNIALYQRNNRSAIALRA